MRHNLIVALIAAAAFGLGVLETTAIYNSDVYRRTNCVFPANAQHKLPAPRSDI